MKADGYGGDILVDYHELYAALDTVLAVLDHRFLNDVMDTPTTCENLCRWIREQLRTHACCTNLISVRVSEQRGTSCTLLPMSMWKGRNP
jgi:6-pyruvoyl-tetrahydropterin synthase